MRKRYKKKRHSCPMCKGYKMNGSCRWEPKEKMRLERDEREIRRFTRY